MAELFKEFKTKVALKQNTYEYWTTSNETTVAEKTHADYVPLYGEVCFCEIPTGNTEATNAPTVLFKVGNGTAAFKNLNWTSALAADVFSWAKQSKNDFVNTFLSLEMNDGTTMYSKLNGIFATDEELSNAIAGLKNELNEALAAETAAREEADTAINNKIGEIPADATANTVIGYVDEKVAAINSNASDLADAIAAEKERAEAAEGALSEALTNETNRATGAEGELSAAIATEKGRAEAAEGVLTKAIADEVTRATGKEDELAAAIATEQGRAEAAEGVLTQAIADEASRATEAEGVLTKAIADEKARAEAAEGVLTQAVADEKARAEAAEAGIQNQINTIMNNPDAEGAINSINEFTKYVEEHGTIAEGMRQDINKNKEDIAANAKALTDHETHAADTYETKADATSKKEALDGRIDELAGTHATDKAAIEKTVADNKTELQNEIAAAIEAAKEDASKKAAVVLAEAQKYADDNDADTTYTAAADGGLKLTGTEFAIDDEIIWVLNCNY